MTRRSGLFAALLCAVLVASLGTSASLARFTGATDSAVAIAADVLQPPTSLAGTGGATASLTWTPTVDTYASGYQVLRSATAGTGHAVVGTVTPGTASSATDSPGVGTWYYLLRSTYQGWTSGPSNEATVTLLPPASTAFVPCVSNAADTSGAGDNDGYDGTPARACASDNQYATDSNSGSGSGGTPSCGTGSTPSATEDRHRFWGFVHGITTASAIHGIEVRADLALNNNSGTDNLCVQLSWDGGTSWTTIRSTSADSVPEQTYVFGGATDAWGRSWTLAELSATNLRVRVIDAAENTNKQYRLDHLAVRVHYTP